MTNKVSIYNSLSQEKEVSVNQFIMWVQPFRYTQTYGYIICDKKEEEKKHSLIERFFFLIKFLRFQKAISCEDLTILLLSVLFKMMTTFAFCYI